MSRVTWMVLWCMMVSGPLPAMAARETTAELRVFIPTVTGPAVALNELQLNATQLTSLLAQSVQQVAGCDVVTEADLVGLAAQAARTQAAGCEGIGCAVELARAVQTDLLLRAEIGLVGERVVMTGTLVHVAEVRVLDIATRLMTADELVTGGMRELAMRLLGPASSRVTAAAVTVAGPRHRVLLVPARWSDGLADDGLKRVVTAKVANVIGQMAEYEVVTSDELASVVQKEADLVGLGIGDPDALGRVATAMDARFLVTMNVARIGGSMVLTASLLDARRTAVVNRSDPGVPREAAVGPGGGSGDAEPFWR